MRLSRLVLPAALINFLKNNHFLFQMVLQYFLSKIRIIFIKVLNFDQKSEIPIIILSKTKPQYEYQFTNIVFE